MAHRHVNVDGVTVPSTDPFAGDVPRVDQVGDDPLGGALGDPDLLGKVTEACVWVAAEAEQDLCVVREEPPPPL
jgi:hypothetical protein